MVGCGLNSETMSHKYIDINQICGIIKIGHGMCAYALIYIQKGERD